MGNLNYRWQEIAVIKHSTGLATKLVDYSSGRLQNLFRSFFTLRSNNQILVDQLRGNIGELRDLRRQLQQQRAGQGPSPRKGTESHDGLSQEFGLTRRESQVAKLLSQGRSNQSIARELGISEHTARHHTQRVLAKLEVHSRGEAGAKIRG
jgi:DNA-binding CsgD family transcriptional regulator